MFDLIRYPSAQERGSIAGFSGAEQDLTRSRLYTLAPEQERQMSECRQQWLSVARNTQPTDWGRAQNALNLLYKENGKRPPRLVRCTSPWQMCVLASLLNDLKRFGSKVEPPLWQINHRAESLVHQLETEFFNQLDEKSRDAVRITVETWLNAQLLSQANLLVLQLDNDFYCKLRSQRGEQYCPEFTSESWRLLWSRLKQQSESEFGSEITALLEAKIAAQQIDESAIAYRSAMRAVQLMPAFPALHAIARTGCGVEYSGATSRILHMWLELVESVHVFLPFEKICFVSQRPTKFACDGSRFHCEDGAALEYADGYSLYCWHGVFLTREQAQSVICEPETITVESIDQEINREVARIMLERYGISRYLIDSGAQLLHEDEFGRLYSKRIPGINEELWMVAVKNATPEADSTAKEYVLQVHPRLCPILDDDGAVGEQQDLTARNAVASTFGLRGEDFWPLIET